MAFFKLNYKGYSSEMLAIAISENVHKLFAESGIFGGKRLNVHRYFAAYQMCFEIGAALGYRFKEQPEMLFSLFANSGGAQDSLAFVRETVIELYGNEIENAQSLGELAPQREEQRVIADLKNSGRITDTDTSDEVREKLAKTNLSDSVNQHLALAVTIGAGIGICYPACYETMVPLKAREEAMKNVENIGKIWVKGHNLTILKLSSGIDLRADPMRRELIKREAYNEKTYDGFTDLLQALD